LVTEELKKEFKEEVEEEVEAQVRAMGGRNGVSRISVDTPSS
jgi:hypothetical protein